jgi:hypothetical protein
MSETLTTWCFGQVAVGLVTKWEVERPIIAKKVVEKEAGFGFGDAWAAFLASDTS